MHAVRLLLFLLMVPWVVATAATTEGEMEMARALVQNRCSLCHGMHGESVSNQYPKLASQHAEYLVKQLFNFKTGQRPSTVMQKMTDDLTAGEIGMLARYFAEQPLSADTVEDPELAVVGRYLYFRGNRWSSVSACVLCHGVYATGGAQMPRLAGQRASYIEGRLREAMRPDRRDMLAAMHSAIAGLTELEIKAVSQYLSGEVDAQ